jgi:translocation and assembly module TamB
MTDDPMPSPGSPDEAGGEPTPRRHRLLVWLGLLVACLALIVGGLAWLASSAGLRWLLATTVPEDRLVVEGISGSLLGTLDIRSLRLMTADFRLRAENVHLVWRPAALLRGRVDIVELSAAGVEALLPRSQAPPSPPTDLRLPLPIGIERLRIGRLQVIRAEGAPPVFAARSIAARLEAGLQQFRLHEFAADLDLASFPQTARLTARGRLAPQPPFALAGEARLVATDEAELQIDATLGGSLSELHVVAQGRGRAIDGSGEAELTPFAAFPLAALKLSLAGLDPKAFVVEGPSARLSIRADLRAVASGGPAWRLAGPVAISNSAPASYDRGGLPLTAARAEASVSPDELRLDELALVLPRDATISGRLAWRWQDATGSADLAVARLDLASIDRRLRPTRLNGRARLSGDAASQVGELKLTEGATQIDARLRRSGPLVELDRLALTHGAAVLSGQGRIEFADRRPVNFKGRLQRFDLSAFLQQAPRSSLNADFELAATLDPVPAGRVAFGIADSRLAGQVFTGRGALSFRGTQAAGGDIDLAVGDNRLSAHGAFANAAAGGGRSPGFSQSRGELDIVLDAPKLEQLGPSFGGALKLQASIAGRLGAADALPAIRFEAAGRDLRLLGGHRLARLAAAGSLQDDVIHATLTIGDYWQGAAHRLKHADLAIDGQRERHELRLKAMLPNEQALNLRAVGGVGGPGRREAWRDNVWQGELLDFVAAGPVAARLLAPARLVVGRDQAMLGEASLAVADGRVEHAGSEWTPRGWHTQGRFAGIDVRPSVIQGAGFAADSAATKNPPKPAGDLRGPSAALRLRGDWRLAQKRSPDGPLDGHFNLVREAGDWALPGDSGATLGISELRFAANIAGDRVHAQLVGRGARLGDWQGGLDLPLTYGPDGWTIADNAPLKGKLAVEMPDLSWIGPLVNSNLQTGGQLSLRVDIAGELDAPRLDGQARGAQLALALLDEGLHLQDGRLLAHFDDSRLLVEQLAFVAPHAQPPRQLRRELPFRPGAGSISVTGNIDFEERDGKIDFVAERLPLTQRNDRWIVVSGRGEARLEGRQLSIVGNAAADAGFVGQQGAGRPRLSEDIVIVGQAPSAAQRARRIEVDFGFDLGEHFHLQASGVEARLAGRLRLRGEPTRPLRASGSIATQEGIIEAYGQRLSIERGIVNFQGPLDDPGLNVYALRKGPAVEAGVEVTGTVRRPLVRLVSVPSVPDPEKLSWLVLGRAPDTGGADASLLLPAAGALFGGQSESITSQIARSVGIDEFTLRQSETGAGDTLSGQIVSVGKRLSSRATLTYEQGLAAAAGLVKLTYQLTPHVSVVTRTGTDNALDVFYTFSFE